MHSNAKFIIGFSSGLLFGYFVGARSRKSEALETAVTLKDAQSVEESSGDLGQRKSELAWEGSWRRPMDLDERSLDPLTAARMTDHNVRGMGSK